MLVREGRKGGRISLARKLDLPVPVCIRHDICLFIYQSAQPSQQPMHWPRHEISGLLCLNRGGRSITSKKKPRDSLLAHLSTHSRNYVRSTTKAERKQKLLFEDEGER